ncbi:hypothetical protein ACVWW4_004122 [Bradyrhizobium sp. LB7.1]
MSLRFPPMEQRCRALAFHRPVRHRARSIYGAPQPANGTCQERPSRGGFAAVDEPAETAVVLAIRSISRSDLAPRGVDQNYLAQGTLRTPHSQSPAQVPPSENENCLHGIRHRLSAFVKNVRATSLGGSLRAPPPAAVRYSPTSEIGGMPGVGWSYRSAAAVVISRLCGGPTLTGWQGRKRQLSKISSMARFVFRHALDHGNRVLAHGRIP